MTKIPTHVLIIGGAGFIGINSAEYFLSQGSQVTIFDNFSRMGVESNVKWLQETAADTSKLNVIRGDVRTDQKKLEELVKDVDLVLHLAAQVAVTSSVTDPRNDFEINALGTFNVLEAIRVSGNKPVLIYASTNKVYGDLADIPVKELDSRYEFANLPLGVSEERGIDFHSPYGCSKGTADQYVRDYHRIYGLRSIVFRQSCIYGQHQFGVEDQGWVAWFLIALTLGKQITIYGKGKQVRDLLYVSDLVRAYHMAFENIDKTEGQIYNIGGGSKNAVSIWFDLLPTFEKLLGQKISPKFAEERPGDQPIFIADISKAEREFGWKPEVGVNEGIEKLHSWISQNKELFSHI